jgi:putative phosphoesterase
MQLLIISDIHGNYPALNAVSKRLSAESFDTIINSGDSLVYAPFPNETINWLRHHQAISILGNTDKKVLKLLRGKDFKKPGKIEKRVMYTSTADKLTPINQKYLLGLKKSTLLKVYPTTQKQQLQPVNIGIYHGSPAAHHEFLFSDTPDARFKELADMSECDIIITGHSHTPYHKYIDGIHFINPGSLGRMFDGDPSASCATIELSAAGVTVKHYRISYNVEEVTTALKEQKLPEIYCNMYRQGKKLN